MDKNNKHIDHNSTAQYIDWLRGQGKKPDEAVIEHVATCFECKEEILELSEILDKEDKSGKSRQLWKSNSRLIIRAAAVLVGVLVVALAIEFLRQDDDSIQIVKEDTDSLQLTPLDSAIQNIDTIIPEVKDDVPVVTVVQHDTIKFAENFKPNQGLEVLMNAHFRSDAGDGDLSYQKQKEVYYVGDDFEFDFSNSEDEEIVLLIMDHLGNDVAKLTHGADSNIVTLSSEPGIYYWKLSTSDELLKLGKFKLFSKSN